MPQCGTEQSCPGCPLSLERSGNLLPHELEIAGIAVANLVASGQSQLSEATTTVVLQSLGINEAENNVEDFQLALERQSSSQCQ